VIDKEESDFVWKELEEAKLLLAEVMQVDYVCEKQKQRIGEFLKIFDGS
jgi:hypothetical protein